MRPAGRRPPVATPAARRRARRPRTMRRRHARRGQPFRLPTARGVTGLPSSKTCRSPWAPQTGPPIGPPRCTGGAQGATGPAYRRPAETVRALHLGGRADGLKVALLDTKAIGISQGAVQFSVRDRVCVRISVPWTGTPRRRDVMCGEQAATSLDKHQSATGVRSRLQGRVQFAARLEI